MELWHRSIVYSPIGTHLLPMAYWYDNDKECSFIYFHESRSSAMLWGACDLCGYSLYRTDSSKVKCLEKHPYTPRVWRTRLPLPFSDTQRVSFRANDATLPRLLDMVRSRAAELGTSE